MALWGAGKSVVFPQKRCDEVATVAIAVLEHLLSENENLKNKISIRPFAMIEGQVMALGCSEKVRLPAVIEGVPFHLDGCDGDYDLARVAEDVRLIFEKRLARKIHLVDVGLKISLQPSGEDVALEAV